MSSLGRPVASRLPLCNLRWAFLLSSDLALRNCLLTADLTVKIGDYGLSHCKYKVSLLWGREPDREHKPVLMVGFVFRAPARLMAGAAFLGMRGNLALLSANILRGEKAGGTSGWQTGLCLLHRGMTVRRDLPT